MVMTSKLTCEFAFKSHYQTVDGVKIHYVDEGAGDPIVFLHGVPTWSYLWRNVIPTVAQNARCIAPDLVGMGLSDKPNIAYTLADHLHYITQFLNALNLKNITLVMHGWGSVIGSHYAMQHESRIKGLVFYESHIRPPLESDTLSLPIQQFLSLIRDEQHGYEEVIENNYLIETLLPSGLIHDLSEAAMNQYRRPFPTPESRKSLLQYVRDFPKGNGEPKSTVDFIHDYSERLKQSLVPKLMFYGIPGLLTTIADVKWAKDHLPNLEIVDLGEALHLAPESAPLLFANELVEWYERIPVSHKI